MGQKVLLLVDDEVDLVNSMKVNLEDVADIILTANNGIEALEVLGSNEVHCVVCDINMPVMNGVQLLRKLREMNNNVTFIFYTGHGNDALMMEAVKYGAFDFLNKPQMNGLEESVIRGINEGYNRTNGIESDNRDFMSDFQILMKQINDPGKK